MTKTRVGYRQLTVGEAR